MKISKLGKQIKIIWSISLFKRSGLFNLGSLRIWKIIIPSGSCIRSIYKFCKQIIILAQITENYWIGNQELLRYKDWNCRIAEIGEAGESDDMLKLLESEILGTKYGV